MTKQRTLLSIATVLVTLLEQSKDEGPDADKQWLYDEFEEMRRRLSASINHNQIGRPRICDCGTCVVCVRREKIIKNRKAKLKAVA